MLLSSDSAVPDDKSVMIAWESGNPDSLLDGYRLYYRPGGKVQLAAGVQAAAMYTDASLMKPQKYCY